MKKFILFLTLLLMPILSVYAAGSVTVSKSSLTITTGSSATFNVTAKNAAGRIDISSSNKNVATVSVSNAFLDNSSVKVKVTAKSEGTATININLTDVATYDGAVLSGTKTVKITVKKATPAAPKTVVKKEMEITNFEIVGYDIDFDVNKGEYSIDIDKSIDSVYILVEGKNFTATGDKKVKIDNLTQTIVTLKDDVKEVSYTIKFNKKEPIIETKTEKETIIKTQTDKKYMYLSIGLGALSFILLVVCLTKKSEKKDVYKPNSLMDRNRPIVVNNNPTMDNQVMTPQPRVDVVTVGMRPSEVPTNASQQTPHSLQNPATPGFHPIVPETKFVDSTSNVQTPVRTEVANAQASDSKFIMEDDKPKELRPQIPTKQNIPDIDKPDFIEVK